MAVKAVFALAAALAITIAMLLPMPGNQSQARTSSIPTMDVSG